MVIYVAGGGGGEIGESGAVQRDMMDHGLCVKIFRQVLIKSLLIWMEVEWCQRLLNLF